MIGEIKTLDERKDKLIKLGKQQGYITYEQLASELKGLEIDSDSLDNLYNALTEEDITHGLNIVGTGSILASGEVEEIGGVKYKVLAAAKKNADIFFCPEENYKEAEETKAKRNLNIDIVSVANLSDAINYLENYEN